MVLLQHQMEKNGGNGNGGWTSVGSQGTWPQSSVVTAKNISANEWSTSWTSTASVPLTKALASTQNPLQNPLQNPPPMKKAPPPPVAAAVPPPPTPKDVKPTIEDELSRQSLYKTELCRSFSETGVCRYGHKCQFAHGEHELRATLRHPKYKTEFCKRFATTGNCPYGPRCRFIHPGINGNWSTSWSVDDPLADELEELSIKQSHMHQQQQQDAQQDEEASDADEPPRRLAIFQNLTKV